MNSSGGSDAGHGRRPAEAVNGVLLLDKPRGPGSTSVLARAKYLLNAKKAGHTGTLDPLASGLLPLCFGEATKFAQDLLDADKAYRATLCLGITTASGDAEGEITSRASVQCGLEQVREVLASLVGAQSQVPPMFSALKVDGRPLYELARDGKSVARESRFIVVHRLELVAFAGTELIVDVCCSKGTYVRVLAEDIGRMLGCGAHLSDLRRTAVGTLSVSAAVSLSLLEETQPAERQAMLLPVDALVTGLPRLDLDAPHATRFCHGQRIALVNTPATVRLRVYGLASIAGGEMDTQLLGVATVDGDGVLRPERLLSRPSA